MLLEVQSQLIFAPRDNTNTVHEHLFRNPPCNLDVFQKFLKTFILVKKVIKMEDRGMRTYWILT